MSDCTELHNLQVDTVALLSEILEQLKKLHPYKWSGPGDPHRADPNPPPSKTTGERIAEKAVTNRYCGGITMESPVQLNSIFLAWPRNFAKESVEPIRRVLADVIDKAIADERDACAKEADYHRTLLDAPADYSLAADNIVTAIRTRK